MSYMRDPFYVWSDGQDIHLDNFQMPEPIFDELVAMRWARLTEEQRRSAMERAVKNYSGNVGCDALCKMMNVPGFAAQIAELAEEYRKNAAP